MGAQDGRRPVQHRAGQVGGGNLGAGQQIGAQDRPPALVLSVGDAVPFSEILVVGRLDPVEETVWLESIQITL